MGSQRIGRDWVTERAHTHTHTHMYRHKWIYIYTHCMYMCIYIYIHTHVCIHIYACLCSVASVMSTLCYPTDYSLPGFSVHGISPARILDWVAISSSKGSSQPRDQTQVSWVSCIGRFFTTEPSGKPCTHTLTYVEIRITRKADLSVYYLLKKYWFSWQYILCIILHIANNQDWRRQWHPTPVLLPGKSHGWRRLVGCSPWGR